MRVPAMLKRWAMLQKAALRFLYGLRHYKLCEVSKTIWGQFSHLQIAVLIVNYMSDGAVKLGQSQEEGEALSASSLLS